MDPIREQNLTDSSHPQTPPDISKALANRSVRFAAGATVSIPQQPPSSPAESERSVSPGTLQQQGKIRPFQNPQILLLIASCI